MPSYLSSLRPSSSARANNIRHTSQGLQAPILGTPEIAPDFVHWPGPLPKWAEPLSAGAQAALDEAKSLFLARIAAVPLDSLRPIQALVKPETPYDKQLLGWYAGLAGEQLMQMYADQSNGGYILGIKEPGTWELILVQNMYKGADVYDKEELVSHHLTNDAGRQASYSMCYVRKSLVLVSLPHPRFTPYPNC